MNFKEAAELVKKLQNEPSNDEKLELYGLYKQVTVGDINTTRPGFWDMVGKAKWDAWKARDGISKEECETLYISFVKKLSSKYGIRVN